MLNSELFSYINNPIKIIPNLLYKAGYEVAYGNYNIDDIHNALIDEQPVFLSFKGKTYIAIGDTPDTVFISDGKNLSEVDNSQFIQNWDSNACIVINQAGGQANEMDSFPLVIHASERDSWDEEFNSKKDYCLSVVSRINLGKSHLPTHPVILVFKQPGDADIKAGIKSMTVGPEIYIYDPSDSVSEFFHELGHVYWSNRLNSDEFETIQKRFDLLNGKNLPALFTTDWSWKDASEYFATVYMWYCKGIYVNPGYLELLKQMDYLGYKIIHSIIERLETEIVEHEDWKKGEEVIADIILKAESMKCYLVDNRIIKARKAIPAIKDIRFNYNIMHKQLSKVGSICYVRIDEGLLKGRVLPVCNGFVSISKIKDYPVMIKSVRDRSHLLDVVITDKNGIKRHVKINPNKKGKVSVKNSEVIPDLSDLNRSNRKFSFKKFFSKLIQIQE